MSKCKVCNVPIVFVRIAETGKLMPCNPGADPNGNIACRKKGALYVDGYVITAARPLDDDMTPLLAHWATCAKRTRSRPAAATQTPRRPADTARLF